MPPLSPSRTKRAAG